MAPIDFINLQNTVALYIKILCVEATYTHCRSKYKSQATLERLLSSLL